MRTEAMAALKKEHEGGMRLDRWWWCADDQNKEEVERELVSNCWWYGKQQVPIGKETEKEFKMEFERGLTLIGFADSDRVPRHLLLNQAEAVFPLDASEQNVCAFNAIVLSCLAKKKVGVARFVPRKGAGPHLASLQPHISSKGQKCFYLCKLPTREEMRQHDFGSIKISTEKQREVTENLIDQLDLQVMEEGREALRPQRVQNPTLQ